MITPDPKPKPHKKRKPPGQDKKYLAWIRDQPCCGPNCKGKPGDIVPAHMRCLGEAGTGMKPDDKMALPLCFWCHAEEHRGPIRFWNETEKWKAREKVSALCREHLKRYEEQIPE